MQNTLQQWLDRKPAGRKPRKPVKKRSAKRQRQDPEYRAAKRMHLREHPTCQISPIIRKAGFKVRCTGRATHVHHVWGRIGELLCDREHFLSSCSGECHPQWIHESHKLEAIELGLLK